MIKDIVNSADWEEVEVIIEKKLHDLLTDFPEESGIATMACHALANKKAYKMLSGWLADMGFHKGQDKQVAKRDFR